QANFTATAPTTYTLTVSKSPTAGGTVTSSPSGISCGSTCSYSYTSGTQVSLLAEAASGYYFLEWSECTAYGGNICYITMNSTKSVTANFSSTTPEEEEIDVPTVTTNAASSITSDRAALNGTITNIGGESVTTRGFQYGLSQTPSITASSPGSFGTGAYSLDTLALNTNTKYYFRAFATNSAGTGYGSWLSFTAGQEEGDEEEVSIPTVTTNAASSITTTSATLNGKIDSTGGSSVLEKGFDWGTSSGSLTNELTQTGTYSTGSFTKYLSGLTPGTKYYFQAKARNSSGWDYGSELSFTAGTAPLYFSLSRTPTSDTIVQGDSAQTSITATLTSGSADSISFEASNLPTGATATFSPTSCTLSCTSVLTIDTSNSTPVSSKTITIKAIGGPTTKSTTFYLKVTAASEETTTKPSVTTNAATSITNTSAILNGKINSIGSSSVLEKGFDWGTGSGSLINEWKQAGTFSAGNFSKSLTGLTSGTKYYYKAKARNSSVWVYGSQLSFTAGTTSTGNEEDDELIQLLLSQIQQIMAQIAQLQEQLALLTGTPVSWCHTFTTNLAIGVSGPEVEALQSALEKQGLYRKGTKSSYFDESLASAVVGFQQKYSSEILTPWRLRYGTGFVGNTTRIKLNALYGCR
ncbi:MAG TPA: peptidoglycan-binding protein, partial [Candidatus Paceibacterota bacterium]|nr:peptidoglycan-binding protein [Candidatus Paceibacterota bacterium]